MSLKRGISTAGLNGQYSCIMAKYGANFVFVCMLVDFVLAFECFRRDC